MRQDLISRGFKFEVVMQRRSDGRSFTPEEYRVSAEKAANLLPPDLAVTEIMTETEVEFVIGKDEIEMTTIIYWKPQ